jgi:hypothetical protein
LIPCLVIGDSLAAGTATALPACHAEAVVGISSAAWVQRFGGHNDAPLVVISLGANDGAATHTKSTIQALRHTVRACRVVWLLPAYPAPARAAIRTVAAQFGDRMVDTAPYAPPGGLHPSGRGYAAVARQATAMASCSPGTMTTLCSATPPGPAFSRIQTPGNARSPRSMTLVAVRSPPRSRGHDRC